MKRKAELWPAKPEFWKIKDQEEWTPQSKLRDQERRGADGNPAPQSYLKARAAKGPRMKCSQQTQQQTSANILNYGKPGKSTGVMKTPICGNMQEFTMEESPRGKNYDRRSCE
jgi:hypothetical protein